MGCRSSKDAVREPGAKPHAGGEAAPPLGEGDPAATLCHNRMKHGYAAAAAVAMAATATGENANDSAIPIAQTVTLVLSRIVGSLSLDEDEGKETPHAGAHRSASVPAGQYAGQSVGSGDS